MESLGETLCFGRFRLHPTQGLRAGKREVRITPKSLNLLHALATRAGQVVSKEELFRIVWPKSIVSDATLTSSIKEIRRALHDDARTPHYIETVHRRGFRFLAPTTRDDLPGTASQSLPTTSCVGRDEALRQLESAFAQVNAGRRQLALVSGEPGVGKTTLTQAFEQRMQSRCIVTRAECVRHFGPGEAYQPLLEILARLARGPLRRELIPALRRFAPLWLAQMPALLTSTDAKTLARRTAGATPERMLRELSDVLEELSGDTALILCIEDLQWSDPATLDWLACFARRPERARVLIIGTCRSGEASASLHLLEQLAGELQARDLCKAIELAPLDESAVVTYVMQRFAAAQGEEQAMQALARSVHARTEGNPLFFVGVLDELVARRALVDCEGSWRVAHPVCASELGLPPDLRQTIQQQIGRLDSEARALLDVASLLSGSFAAATVAAGAGMPAPEAERRLAALARSRTLVRQTGSAQWPDGTVSATFELVHALYADALREILSPGRCAELHRAVGMRLEAAFGPQASRIAAELAMHFDEGRELRRAIRFHELAARNNLRLSAHASAQRHFARALELLDSLEPSTLRDQLEIDVQLGLGNVLMQTDGWAAPDVQAAYARASDLCRKQGATQQLFPALWNLWVFNAASGELDRAHGLATQLHELACTSGDPASMLQAHHANWTTLYSRGDLAGCAAHTRDGMQLYRTGRVGDLEYGSHDCGVCARMFSARTLALFGETEKARRHLNEGIALAEQLAHPFTRAFGLTHAAAVCLELDDPLKCREYGEAARAVAREWQFPLLDAWAACYMGASLAQLDEAAAGLAMISDGIDRARAMGSEMFQPHLFGLLADAHLRNRSAEDGLRCVSEALAISARTGERFYLAELHRIKGELHWVQESSRAGRLQAESEFRKALAVAHSQHASLPAARVSTALLSMR